MLKCVVVDDEYEIRQGICKYFPWDSVGFEVSADFDCARDALSYIRDHAVDAVLTDVRMPGMSGIDLIREIRDIGMNLPIVVLSGYRDFEYARQAMTYGVRHYIVKPARTKDIQAVFLQVATEIRSSGKNSPEPSFQEHSIVSGKETTDIIRRINHYISLHYAEATLISMADYVGVTPHYLSSIYHQSTGQKLSNVLLDVRMRKAGQLLTTTHQHISEISALVGYDSANSFSRAFRMYYHVTPREYRILQKQDGKNE